MALFHVSSVTRLLQLLALIIWVDLVTSQYNVGICRPPLIKPVFNDTVTLEMMVNEGEYTVLFTSGLKQYQNVVCARVGYSYNRAKHMVEFYSYFETDNVRGLIPYPVKEVMPGKFMVQLVTKDISFHYIAYKVDDVLLLYWCKYDVEPDDNYDNNIWLIAAKTNRVAEEATQRAVLQMLYHEDYRALIDNTIQVVRRTNDNVPKYLELTPCQSTLYDNTDNNGEDINDNVNNDREDISDSENNDEDDIY